MSDLLAGKYGQYIAHVIKYREAHPEQRLGQAYMNALTQFDADASRAVHGTPLDPFFGDDVLGDFRAWLRARWGDIDGGRS